MRGGEAIVELIRSWVAIVPDVEVWFETLASDERHIVMRIGGRGHAAADAGEGSMQYDFTLVGRLRDGQMVYEELFADGDEAAALARYEAFGVSRARPAQTFASRSRDTVPSDCLRARCSSATPLPGTRATGTQYARRSHRHPLRRSSPGRLGGARRG